MKRLCIVLVCLIISNVVMAANIWWQGTSSSLWNDPINWHSNIMPVEGDQPYISKGSTYSTAIVDYTTPAYGVFRTYAGSIVNVQTGGTLTVGNLALGIGSDNPGELSELIVSGGTVSADIRHVYLANDAGHTSVITITSGLFKAYDLIASNGAGSTGKVNLEGGTMELTRDSSAALILDADGTMEFSGNGTLILQGNLKIWLENGVIANGYMYTVAVEGLDVIYNATENKTYVTVVPPPLGTVIIIK